MNEKYGIMKKLTLITLEGQQIDSHGKEGLYMPV